MASGEAAEMANPNEAAESPTSVDPEMIGVTMPENPENAATGGGSPGKAKVPPPRSVAKPGGSSRLLAKPTSERSGEAAPETSSQGSKGWVAPWERKSCDKDDKSDNKEVPADEPLVLKDDWEDDEPDTFHIRAKGLGYGFGWSHGQLPRRLKDRVGVEGLFFLRVLHFMSRTMMICSAPTLVMVFMNKYASIRDAADDTKRASCAQKAGIVTVSLSNQDDEIVAWLVAAATCAMCSWVCLKSFRRYMRLEEAKHMPSMREEEGKGGKEWVLPVDFVVVVERLPKDMDTPEELKEYMERFGEVLFCDIIPDHDKMMDKVLHREHLDILLDRAKKAREAMALGDGPLASITGKSVGDSYSKVLKENKLASKMQKRMTALGDKLEGTLSTQIATISEEIEEMLETERAPPHFAIVTFKWLGGALKSIRSHTSPFGLKSMRKCEISAGGLKGKKLKVQHACADPIWANHVGVSTLQRWMGSLACVGLATGCIVGNCVLLNFIKSFSEDSKKEGGRMAKILPLLSAALMLVSNTAAKTMIKKLAHITFRHSEQEQEVIEMILVGFAKSVNCTVVPFITYFGAWFDRSGCYDGEAAQVVHMYMIGLIFSCWGNQLVLFLTGLAPPVPFDYADSFTTVMPIVFFAFMFFVPFPIVFPICMLGVTGATALFQSNLIFVFPKVQSMTMTLPAWFCFICGFIPLACLYVGGAFFYDKGYGRQGLVLCWGFIPVLVIGLVYMYWQHMARLHHSEVTPQEYEIRYDDVADFDEETQLPRRYEFNDPPLLVGLEEDTGKMSVHRHVKRASE
eukprot:TRINITY_DN75537_c0_g1_i1.p1 TRINITY_DN75537_c0_g1~~TRINITY_DN75537_c0_g1_i1.p1  ORF type:complete len:799 (-),score=216.38 TRINITY_DN75537_c0_g1_i1:48-2444(-)